MPLFCSTLEKGEMREKGVGVMGGGKEIGCGHSWRSGAAYFAFIEKWETVD